MHGLAIHVKWIEEASYFKFSSEARTKEADNLASESNLGASALVSAGNAELQIMLDISQPKPRIKIFMISKC